MCLRSTKETMLSLAVMLYELYRLIATNSATGKQQYDFKTDAKAKNVIQGVQSMVINNFHPDEEKRGRDLLQSQSDEMDLAHGSKDGVWTQLTTLIYMKKEPFRAGTKIYEAEQRNASGIRRLAVKLNDLNEKNLKEAKALSKLLYHSNVVQIIESSELDGRVRQFYIAMELCHHDNLQDHIKTNVFNNVAFSFDQTMNYTKQLVAGIIFIHENGIIHRDLKPENVLFSLDKKFLKIADFGISKELKKGRSVTRTSSRGLGTDGYRAPETYESNVISPKTDIYSLGLVIHVMWSNGKHPFGSEEIAWGLYIKKNENRDLSGLLIPEGNRKRQELLGLLEDLLKFEPKDRPVAKAVELNSFFRTEEEQSAMGGVDLVDRDVRSEETLPKCLLEPNPGKSGEKSISKELCNPEDVVTTGASCSESPAPQHQPLTLEQGTGDAACSGNLGEMPVSSLRENGITEVAGTPDIHRSVETSFPEQEASQPTHTGEVAGTSSANIGELPGLLQQLLTPENGAHEAPGSGGNEGLGGQLLSIQQQALARGRERGEGATRGSNENLGALGPAVPGQNDLRASVERLIADPVYQRERIGRDGGVIQVRSCKLDVPRSGDLETCVEFDLQVIPRSNDMPLPEGYQAISPVLGCSPLDHRFLEHARITLPLSIEPTPGIAVQILRKSNLESLWIEHLSLLTADTESVTFDITNCGWYAAALKMNSPDTTSTVFQSFLFSEKASAALYVLTCPADSEQKAECISTLENRGYKNAFPLPDNVALTHNEKIRYRLECLFPNQCQILPEGDVELIGAAIASNKFEWRSFKLCPPPPQATTHLQILYSVELPNAHQKKESVIAIEWHTDLAHVRTIHNCSSTASPNEGAMDASVRESTPEFYNSHLSDDTIYSIDPDRTKGKVLIINNSFPGQRLSRGSSDVDVQNMRNLWTDLGFKVLIMKNLSAEGMVNACKDFSSGAADVCCLVVIIMTHGGKGPSGREYFMGEDDEKISMDDVIDIFSSRSSPRLCGIPKLFLFQACRGDAMNVMDVINLVTEMDYGTTDGSVMVDASGPVGTEAPQRADMLIAYPSQAGYVAMRNTIEGSWLISAIAEIFRKHAHDSHVLDMLTMVNHNVAKRVGVLPGRSSVMQTSNQESYLTKKLYLFPGWPKK